MGLVVLVVCMSRVYMAAHFPHQVIAGVITGENDVFCGQVRLCSSCSPNSRYSSPTGPNKMVLFDGPSPSCGFVSGVLVAEVISKEKWIYDASMRKYFHTTLSLTSLAVGFYLLLRVLGVDLLWTMEKAQKWCVNPEWVHLDSTPFASLLRNMGTLFGLGLGLHSPLYSETKTKNTSTGFRMGCIIVSLFLLHLLDGWTFSSENLTTFYFLSFGKSAVALLIPTTLVPFTLCWIRQGKTEDKNL